MYRTVCEKLTDQGRQAAAEWLETAAPDEMARICEFRFADGRTALADPRAEGFSLPFSLDLDFSKGFWERVMANV